MNVRKVSAILFSVSLFSLLLAGCGNASKVSSTNHIDTDTVTSYSSLSQLQHDAKSVALLQPTGMTSVTNIAGIPYTISTVKVLKYISGVTLPSSFGLRQLGTFGNTQNMPVVATGRIYLAYVQPFALLSGVVAGQYVVIGGLQGLFEGTNGTTSTAVISSANISKRQYVRVDSDATQLPTTISVSDAQTG